MTYNEPKMDIWKKEGVKFVYVRRFQDGKDLGFIDIPLPDLETTLKRHPDWVVLGPAGDVEKVGTKEETLPEAIDPTFVCPICNKEFKTEKGLQLHKGKVHK